MAAALPLMRGGGKSGLHRTGCWVTPSPGNRKESATERRPPLLMPDASNGVRVKG